jgi:hypothetical protein
MNPRCHFVLFYCPRAFVFYVNLPSRLHGQYSFTIAQAVEYLVYLRAGQYPPVHPEGWMLTGQETVFC